MEPIFEYYGDYKSMTVVEPSEVFFQNAVDKAKKLSNVTLINDFFEKVELKVNPIDFILVSGLLHEIPDIEDFLNEIKCKCSNETIIHVNVPNAHSFHRLLAYKSGMIDKPEDFSSTQIKLQVNRIFTLSTLKSLVEMAGFEVIDSGSYFIKPFTHAQMKFLFDNKIINNEILEGFYNMTEYMPELGSEIFVDLRLKR